MSCKNGKGAETATKQKGNGLEQKESGIQKEMEQLFSKKEEGNEMEISIVDENSSISNSQSDLQLGRKLSTSQYEREESDENYNLDYGGDDVEEEDTYSSTCFTYIETTVQIETPAKETLEEEPQQIPNPRLILPFEYRKKESEFFTENGEKQQILIPNLDKSTKEGKIKHNNNRHANSSSGPGLGGGPNETVLNSAGSYPQDNRHPQKQTLNIFTQYKDEIVSKKESSKPLRNAFSLDSRLDDRSGNEEVREKLRTLISDFSKRTTVTKEKIRKPVTPTYDTSSDSLDDEPSGPQLLNRLNEFFPTSNEGSSTNVWTPPDPKNDIFSRLKLNILKLWKRSLHCLNFNFALDPQSKFYVGWLAVVSFCFLYNAWVIPLRLVFPYQSTYNVRDWLIMDSVCDFIYLIDIAAVQSHIKYISNGFRVNDPKEIRSNYFHSFRFKAGLITLLPMDIVWALFFSNKPLLRLPRILKIETFWELFRRFDSVLSSPYPIRIARSFLYMLYLIHMYACAYYALSTWERSAGYHTDWIFDGYGNAYVRCFYFATKTATSIGKNPKPENEIEYLFMTCAWLSGVFVFAILIGQIRDIIATATKSQTEYRQLLYTTVNYLHRLEVPKELQERVKLWLTYTWEQQKTLDEKSVLSLLPHKMQTDIALHVHIEMLNKVKLFQRCEVAFLRDLVLKLRSVIFLPGDYVCKKGETGREMYIVKTGRVDVIGGEAGAEKLLASLTAGSVFGEIALLHVGGMDKRTADVQSVGFSNLFLLTKKDIEEVIKDYPQAQDSLKKQARKLMKQNQKKLNEEKRSKSRAKTAKKESRQKEDKKANKLRKTLSSSTDSESESSHCIIKGVKKRQPKLLETVLQIVPPNSKTAQYLQYGFKAASPQGSILSISSYPQSPFLPVNMQFDKLNTQISLSNSSSEHLCILSEDEDGNALKDRADLEDTFDSLKSTDYSSILSLTMDKVIQVKNVSGGINESSEISASASSLLSRGQLCRQDRLDIESKDLNDFP